MSSVAMPRLRRTSYSASPKSSPTGPTTRTSQKKLAASEKWTAEPPSMRSRSPNGVLTASKAIDPTTTRLTRRGRVSGRLTPGCRWRRVTHMVRVATIVVAAMAVLAAPVGAKTFTAQQGAVRATIAYNKTTTTRLTIARNGATVYDDVPNVEACGGAPCGPSGFVSDPPLRVADLDADGEPEVVYSAYTGGAHCCSIAAVFRLNPAADGYLMSERNFGDPGFDLKDLNGDGRPEWLTADDLFAYRFTAYAFSGLPVQILRFTAGTLIDRAKDFPAPVRKDARRWGAVYPPTRNRTHPTPHGAPPARAAEQL